LRSSAVQQNDEFGDKQMNRLFVLNSESTRRALLVTFDKPKVTAFQRSRRPLKKKIKKNLLYRSFDYAQDDTGKEKQKN